MNLNVNKIVRLNWQYEQNLQSMFEKMMKAIEEDK